jgi:hypothetical protein
MRYLRGREDGFIYDWNPILAENSSLEEVTEEEAYPERFVPKAQKGRQTKLTLDVQQVDAPKGNRDVDQEASKGL